jgi:hypothetical protein
LTPSKNEKAEEAEVLPVDGWCLLAAHFDVAAMQGRSEI